MMRLDIRLPTPFATLALSAMTGCLLATIAAIALKPPPEAPAGKDPPCRGGATTGGLASTACPATGTGRQ